MQKRWKTYPGPWPDTLPCPCPQPLDAPLVSFSPVAMHRSPSSEFWVPFLWVTCPSPCCLLPSWGPLALSWPRWVSPAASPLLLPPSSPVPLVRGNMPRLPFLGVLLLLYYFSLSVFRWSCPSFFFCARVPLAAVSPASPSSSAWISSCAACLANLREALYSSFNSCCLACLDVGRSQLDTPA